MGAEIDVLIHINDLSLKTLFEDKLAHCPGFTRSPRLSHKSHLLFLQFDQELRPPTNWHRPPAA